MGRTLVLRTVVTILAAIAIIALIAAYLGYRGQTDFDDAYMYLRYARHFLAGHGFSWNAADGPAYGATSPMALFLITLMRRLTALSDGVLLSTFSFTFALLACVALCVMGFVVVRNPAFRNNWLALLVLPIVVFGSSTLYYSTTGMETTLSLFTNALLALAVFHWGRSRSKTAFIICLTAAELTFLVRPDNGFYSGLLPVLYLLASDRTRWRAALLFAGGFLLLLVFDELCYRLLFGDFLPSPFYAKRAGFYRGYVGVHQWNTMDYMLQFLGFVSPFLLLIVCCVTRRTLPRVLAIAIPAALLFGYYLTVTQIMGKLSRFYVPSFPFFALAAFIALDDYLCAQSEGRPHVPRLGRQLIAASVVLVLISPAVRLHAAVAWTKLIARGSLSYQSKWTWRTPSMKPLPEIYWWQVFHELVVLLNRLPAGVSITATEYGYIGAACPDTTIIDMIGLHDRHIAHDGFSAEYVLSKSPDLVWFPEPDYTYQTAQLLDSERFRKEYEFYPGAYRYGLAIRRASPHYAAIKAEFEREFARLYPGRTAADDLAEFVPADAAAAESGGP